MKSKARFFRFAKDKTPVFFEFAKDKFYKKRVKKGENRRKQEKTGEKGITEKTLESYIDVFSDILNVLLFNGEEIIHPDEPEDQTPRSACKADGKIRDKVMSQLTAACPITGCIFYSPFSLNLLMQCLICAAADHGGFSSERLTSSYPC